MDRRINGTAGGLGARLDETRAQIHQAAGMVSVQLDVPIAAALDQLRAYADTHESSIGEVAAHVVAGRLRFDVGGP